MRACLITNPRSGRGGVDLSGVLPVLREHGWDVTVMQKLHGGMATDLARQAAADGYEVVVGCGGDGTLNEIVEGLVGTDTALGAIPGGTVNEWAHEVGISSRLDVAARQLVGAVRKRIDAGHVTIESCHEGHDGQDRQSRHFLLMAGLGLDGAVMARLSKPLKKRIGRLAVGLAAIEALPSFEPVAVRVEIGETLWQGHVWQIIIGNTRRYGGFTSLTPEAYADDGLLDVCLLTAEGTVSLASQAATLLVRGHPDLRSAEVYRAGRVTVQAPADMRLQLDGGTVKSKRGVAPGETTYTFSTIAHGLTVLVPATYHGDLFQKSPVVIAATEAPPGSAGNNQQAGKGPETRAPKGRKARLQVVAVGTDSITAVRKVDNRVVLISVEPDTVLKDAAGHKIDRAAFLSGLSVGSKLHVKKSKDSRWRDGSVKARRIKLMP